MTEQENFNQAIKNNNASKIKILLKNSNFDPSYSNNYAFRISCINGYTPIVKLLLKDSRIKPTDFNHLFGIVCGNGKQEIVRLFLKDKRVKVKEGKTFCIQNAAQNGHFNTVKILLKDKRIDPSDDHNTAIRLAYANNYFNIVKLLWKEQKIKKTLSTQSGLFDTRELYYMLVNEDIKNKINNF